jgi:hypothetical protein
MLVMYDYGSINKFITQLNGTDQLISTTHYGRTEDSLAYSKEASDRSSQNIAEEYYWNAQDDWSFQWNVWDPYFQAKRSADPLYKVINDQDRPIPAMGLATKLVEKYQNLSDSLSLKTDQAKAGLMSELQPYWERMLIDSAIQSEVSDQEFERIDSNYLQNGRDGLQDIFENNTYLSTKVLFSYAQGDAFLNLDQEYQIKFVSMSLEQQYEMVFISEEQRLGFIDNNTGYYVSPSVSVTNYDTDLTEDKKNIDLTALMARFEEHVQANGVDYEAKFEATFKEQTQDINFSTIAYSVNNVYQLYHGFLGRAPDKDGFEYWVKALTAGHSLEQISENFVASAEFIASTGAAPGSEPTFNQVLSTLYNVILDREFDQVGYNYWQDLYVNQGAALGLIVTGFTKSEEFISNVAADRQAWLSITYGPNLVDMDISQLFSDEQIAEIQVVGSEYNSNLDFGYTGTVL